MLAGPGRLRRHHSRTHRAQRTAASAVFDIVCPNIRRYGRCRRNERHLKRLEDTTRRQEEQRELLAERDAMVEAGELGREEVEADDDPFLSQQIGMDLWDECPFKHPLRKKKRGRKAEPSREMMAAERIAEFFAVGRHTLTVTLPRDYDMDSDDDAAETEEGRAARGVTQAERTLTKTFVVRQGSMVEASDLRMILTAYMAQDAAAETHQRRTAAKLEGTSVAARAAAVLTEMEINLDSPRFAMIFARALLLLAQGGIVVDSIRARRNKLVSTDPLVGALRKHGLSETLASLDVQENELDSMRVLFALKAHFPALLCLWMADNPITRKPDYREQVRKTLPELFMLDGEPIRRPPLALPHPLRQGSAVCPMREKALRYVNALTAAFEARRIDEDFALEHFEPGVTFSMTTVPGCSLALPADVVTAAERAALELHSELEKAQAPKQGPVEEEEEEEEEEDEDEDEEEDEDDEEEGRGQLYDPGQVRRGVQLSGPRDLLLLSPQDKKEARLFAVAVANMSRDVREGRTALHNFARGPMQVAGAYTATLYPPRFPCDHHLDFASVTVDYVDFGASAAAVAPGMSATARRKPKRGAALPEGVDLAVPQVASVKPAPPVVPAGAGLSKPSFVLVTLHGMMSWRVPSAHGGVAIRVFYDRTLTLLPRKGGDDSDDDEVPMEGEPVGDWERRALRGFRLANDQLTLRPLKEPKAQDVVQTTTAREADNARAAVTAFEAVFTPFTAARAKRLAVIFSVEERFARHVLERSTSDLGAFESVRDAATAAGATQVNLGGQRNAPDAAAEPGLERQASVVVSSLAGGSAECTVSELEGLLGRHQSTDAFPGGVELTEEAEGVVLQAPVPSVPSAPLEPVVTISVDAETNQPKPEPEPPAPRKVKGKRAAKKAEAEEGAAEAKPRKKKAKKKSKKFASDSDSWTESSDAAGSGEEEEEDWKRRLRLLKEGGEVKRKRLVPRKPPSVMAREAAARAKKAQEQSAE